MLENFATSVVLFCIKSSPWLRSVRVSVSDFRRNEPGSMPVPYYLHSSGNPMTPCKICGTELKYTNVAYNCVVISIKLPQAQICNKCSMNVCLVMSLVNPQCHVSLNELRSWHSTKRIRIKKKRNFYFWFHLRGVVVWTKKQTSKTIVQSGRINVV